MAAKIKEVLGVEATLVPGKGGVFDTIVDGRLVYSKFETGLFPDEEQLVSELSSFLGDH